MLVTRQLTLTFIIKNQSINFTSEYFIIYYCQVETGEKILIEQHKSES